jgi:hypothetical protein
MMKLLINNFGNGLGSMSIGLAVTNESQYSSFLRQDLIDGLCCGSPFLSVKKPTANCINLEVRKDKDICELIELVNYGLPNIRHRFDGFLFPN